MHAAIWALAAAITAWVAGRLGRTSVSTETVAAGVGLAAATTAMIALSIVWRSNHASPLTLPTGNLEFLRRYDPQGLAFRLNPMRRLEAAQLLPEVALVSNNDPAHADGPLLLLDRPPAATYEISADITGAGAGLLTITIDREFGPQWKIDLHDARGSWRQVVNLPVAVSGLAIDGDAATRRALGSISIRALQAPGWRNRLTESDPIHAVRHGPAVVYLLDGHAFTEPAGTWIAGGQDASFAIAPDPGAPIRLFVRNAPVQNDVTLESGSWRQTLALKPGEERIIDVPPAAAGPGVLLRVATTAGFRPADVDPAATDRRLLGCWIETR
jgi:hypothetical protein